MADMSAPASGSTGSLSLTESESDQETVDPNWPKIDFDWFNSEEVARAVEADTQIPDPTDQSGKGNLTPGLLRKHVFQSLWQPGGSFDWVEYIPHWTAPGYVDSWTLRFRVKDAQGNDTGQDAEFKTGSSVVKRPALLPQDDALMPTDYARRYGIYRDEVVTNATGRSRMSPVESKTRQMFLGVYQQTPDGCFKHHLDYDDLKAAHVSGLPTPEHLANMPGGVNVNEQAYLLAVLQSTIDDDVNYQRFVFRGESTNDRIGSGMHSLDPNIVKDSNLTGPLNPLLCRPHWVSTVGRGIREENPRLLYNLDGQQGEYTADDDLIWMAIQPALQIVSRVLEIGPDVLHAAVNVFHRQPLDPSRDQRPDAVKNQKCKFNVIYRDIRRVQQIQAAHDLQANGFNAAALVWGYLSDRLELEFRNGFRQPVTGKRSANPEFGDTGVRDMQLPGTSTIRVALAANIIWPLLVSHYTNAEKACASIAFAITLIHELAHACEQAMFQLFNAETVKRPDKVDQLKGLTDRDLANMAAVATHLDGGVNEPYWEDEPYAELGYVTENEIFGGTLETDMDRGYRDRNKMFMQTAIGLEEWPNNNAKPHNRDPAGDVHSHQYILDSPVPLDLYSTQIPVTTVGRYFQQEFWVHDVAKFGHKSLNMMRQTDGLTKVTVVKTYERAKDVRAAFGTGRGVFLSLARDHLAKAGYEIVSQYLDDAIKDGIKSINLRKRFYHYYRTWREQDDKVWAFLVELDRVCTAATKTTNTAIDDIVNKFTEDLWTHRRREFGMEVQQVLDTGEDAHRFLVRNLQHAQTMVVEYLQHPPDLRRLVYDKWGALMRRRLRDQYEDMVQHARKTLQGVLDSLQKLCQLPQVAQLPLAAQDAQESQEYVARVQNKLGIMGHHFRTTRLVMRRDQIDRQDLGWQNQFVTVPMGRLIRRRDRLRTMAMREVLRMPQPIRAIAEKCEELLANAAERLSVMPDAAAKHSRSEAEVLRRDQEQNPASIMKRTPSGPAGSANTGVGGSSASGTPLLGAQGGPPPPKRFSFSNVDPALGPPPPLDPIEQLNQLTGITLPGKYDTMFGAVAFAEDLLRERRNQGGSS